MWTGLGTGVPLNPYPEMRTKTKVKPLKSRTMTLSQLQTKTLKVLRLVRKQFNRAAHEEGMSDNEFLDKVVGQLECIIKSDRAVEKLRKSGKK